MFFEKRQGHHDRSVSHNSNKRDTLKLAGSIDIHITFYKYRKYLTRQKKGDHKNMSHEITIHLKQTRHIETREGRIALRNVNGIRVIAID